MLTSKNFSELISKPLHGVKDYAQDEAMPLLRKLSGSSSYRQSLSAASKALFNLLQDNERLQITSGNSVKIPDQDGLRLIPYGNIPDVQNAKECLWLPALEYLLHSLAHITSSQAERKRYVSVPYGKGRSLRVLFKETGVNGSAFKGAIACLVEIGWLRLFPAVDGYSPYVQACPQLEEWMLQRGLVFEGHPEMPLHS